MREFKTDNHGPVTQTLLAKARAEKRPKTLAMGTPDAEAFATLKSMTDQTISTNRRVRMPHDAEALHAGLWLLFEYFTESHDYAQKIATPSGSYWHAILHRREPDPSNAKYWFARVGEHPVFPELLDDAKEIAEAAGPAGAKLLEAMNGFDTWNADWFVDRCCSPSDPATTAVLLDLQRREWELLFAYNFSKAFA